MPKLMGYAFALFPMWPKLKAASTRSKCGSRSLSAVEGQTHNLRAVPAAAMMKEFFV